MLNLKTIESAFETTVDHADRGDVMRQIANLVRAEFTEMPGLSVTLPQAQRLWGVDERTCRRVFEALVARGILRRSINGRYVRR